MMGSAIAGSDPHKRQVRNRGASFGWKCGNLLRYSGILKAAGGTACPTRTGVSTQGRISSKCINLRQTRPCLRTRYTPFKDFIAVWKTENNIPRRARGRLSFSPTKKE